MALYKDGNPVSGLNSIPRLTLAQYESQNVKPEFWVRTDAPESYKKLSADQVSYDSNNTVKDKIDSIDFVKGDFTVNDGYCGWQNSKIKTTSVLLATVHRSEGIWSMYNVYPRILNDGFVYFYVRDSSGIAPSNGSVITLNICVRY